MTELYDFETETLNGAKTTLAAHRGKALLIVNTASKCAFTPQFSGLEELHKAYADRGFAVLGFPCNQFAKQDPGSADEIGTFCQENYGVTFPMHAKVQVNGPDTHPLYAHLKEQKPGLLGSHAIKWNFTKFLVDPSGKVVKRIAPRTKPLELRKAIEEVLPKGVDDPSIEPVGSS